MLLIDSIYQRSIIESFILHYVQYSTATFHTLMNIYPIDHHEATVLSGITFYTMQSIYY